MKRAAEWRPTAVRGIGRTNFRLLWPCIMNVGWRERDQQDATYLMFIMKLLSQHVSGIIMPIIRRTSVCTAAYGVLHLLWWLWLCGAGTRAVCTVKVSVRTVLFKRGLTLNISHQICGYLYDIYIYIYIYIYIAVNLAPSSPHPVPSLAICCPIEDPGQF